MLLLLITLYWGFKQNLKIFEPGVKIFKNYQGNLRVSTTTSVFRKIKFAASKIKLTLSNDGDVDCKTVGDGV